MRPFNNDYDRNFAIMMQRLLDALTADGATVEDAWSGAVINGVRVSHEWLEKQSVDFDLKEGLDSFYQDLESLRNTSAH